MKGQRRGGRGLTAGSSHIERTGDLKKRCFMDVGGDTGEEMNTSVGLVLEIVKKELEQKIYMSAFRVLL